MFQAEAFCPLKLQVNNACHMVEGGSKSSKKQTWLHSMALLLKSRNQRDGLLFAGKGFFSSRPTVHLRSSRRWRQLMSLRGWEGHADIQSGTHAAAKTPLMVSTLSAPFFHSAQGLSHKLLKTENKNPSLVRPAVFPTNCLNQNQFPTEQRLEVSQNIIFHSCSFHDASPFQILSTDQHLRQFVLFQSPIFSNGVEIPSQQTAKFSSFLLRHLHHFSNSSWHHHHHPEQKSHWVCPRSQHPLRFCVWYFPTHLPTDLQSILDF